MPIHTSTLIYWPENHLRSAPPHFPCCNAPGWTPLSAWLQAAPCMSASVHERLRASVPPCTRASVHQCLGAFSNALHKRLLAPHAWPSVCPLTVGLSWGACAAAVAAWAWPCPVASRATAQWYRATLPSGLTLPSGTARHQLWPWPPGVTSCAADAAWGPCAATHRWCTAIVRALRPPPCCTPPYGNEGLQKRLSVKKCDC